MPMKYLDRLTLEVASEWNSIWSTSCTCLVKCGRQSVHRCDHSRDVQFSPSRLFFWKCTGRISRFPCSRTKQAYRSHDETAYLTAASPQLDHFSVLVRGIRKKKMLQGDLWKQSGNAVETL